jgi:hypothetical protein
MILVAGITFKRFLRETGLQTKKPGGSGLADAALYLRKSL